VALTQDELNLMTRLAMRHDAEIPELEAYDRYYEGTQPLTYMQPEVLREVHPRIRPVIVFWPQLVIGSREERLDIEGFRLPDETDDDDEIWRIWQANDMDEQASMAHVDSLVMRRAYVCVGSNEADPSTPLITVESPLEVYADIDPRTRMVRSALRRVTDVDPLGGVGARYATLYLPNETIWAHWDGGWVEDQRDPHGVGEVLIEPLINRPRLRSGTRHPRDTMVERHGRSELDAVIPLSDAACKLATDMMLAAEFVALPLRALFGADPSQFKDPQGNSLTTLQAMIQGKVLAIPNEHAKAFEFAAAQLANFGSGIREIAQMMSAVGALPPDYLGYSHTNPASAEAGRVAETRLIKRAERIQRCYSGPWERVQRKVRRVATGKWDDDLKRLETRWRDAATPTVAASADAAVKKHQAGITPKRQAREDLGYTDAQIERMEQWDEEEAARSPMGKIATGLADQRLIGADAGAA